MRKELSLTLAVVGIAATLALIHTEYGQNNGTFLSSDSDMGFNNYLAKQGKSYVTKDEYHYRKHRYLKA